MSGSGACAPLQHSVFLFAEQGVSLIFREIMLR